MLVAVLDGGDIALHYSMSHGGDRSCCVLPGLQPKGIGCSSEKHQKGWHFLTGRLPREQGESLCSPVGVTHLPLRTPDVWPSFAAVRRLG